jgi:uncharacterized protein
VPQRRCAGCGRIAGKAELVRLTVAREAPRDRPAAVVIDERARIGGRGAYLCASAPSTPSESCLELALRRGGIARTLRRPVKIDSSDLLESMSR